ncbi:hypothetical protein K435DRAFT_856207 [Dendrothele bispora CBS 962.96]|uniref:CBM1 domain-containing protein n=1 Tax=Dendrothele bispora (strain CBS 962.96) TaxID=1314807 RepID=A0A4S8M911_DENBC|nr:hypothetical protein K435DRAFT_856207 [Dendrothele bispora CBS 962.96]
MGHSQALQSGDGGLYGAMLLKMFSLNRGDEYYIPSTLPSKTGTLFSEPFLVVNPASSAQTLNFVLPFSGVAASDIAQVLTGSFTASNTPLNPNAVTPTTSTITTGSKFSYNAPANSVSILTLAINGSSGGGSTSSEGTGTSGGSTGGSSGGAPKYSQCGGTGYTGSTTCIDSTCTYSYPYYGQCI